MKINQESLSVRQELLHSESKADKGFENWLKTPTKNTTGDDYYRQHQQQLQPCELHFGSQSSAAKKGPIELALREIKTNSGSAELTHSEATCACRSVAQPDTRLRQSDPVVFTSQEPLPLFENKTENNRPIQDNSVLQFNETKVDETLFISQIKTWLAPKKAFKQYQLYIENKQVELSLNCADLNSSQKNEITSLVKDWLINKGLRLQQFIINGVKQ